MNIVAEEHLKSMEWKIPCHLLVGESEPGELKDERMQPG